MVTRLEALRENGQSIDSIAINKSHYFHCITSSMVRRDSHVQERVRMELQPGGVIAWIIVGIVAGWLTGRVMRGRGYGIIGDLILGLAGALVGGFLAGLVIQGSVGLIGSIVVAFLGAVVLVAILRTISGGRASV